MRLPIIKRIDDWFTPPHPLLNNLAAKHFGSALKDDPMSMLTTVGEFKATSVPNFLACSYAARAAGKTLAVADGAMAGFGAHQASIV